MVNLVSLFRSCSEAREFPFTLVILPAPNLRRVQARKCKPDRFFNWLQLKTESSTLPQSDSESERESDFGRNRVPPTLAAFKAKDTRRSVLGVILIGILLGLGAVIMVIGCMRLRQQRVNRLQNRPIHPMDEDLTQEMIAFKMIHV